MKESIKWQAWYEMGSLHRDDGPATLLDPQKIKYLEACPLSELPLYMNTNYQNIVKERLKKERF